MMKSSESRDTGGSVVLVDVVLERPVLLTCLGSTAAVTALTLRTSEVNAFEKCMFTGR